MRHHMTLAMAAALCGGLGITVQADENEVEITLDEAPAAVQATINDHLDGGTILEIERETEGDEVSYSVEVRKDGVVSELEIGADGSLLGTEMEDDDEGEDDESEAWLDAADIPDAVKTAAAAIAGEGAVEGITREREGGVMIYEAEIESGGMEREVELTADGVILEEETEITSDELPAAVMQALTAQYPNLEIREATQVKVHVYEVEVIDGDSIREITVSPTGHIRGEEHDDDDDDHGDDDD